METGTRRTFLQQKIDELRVVESELSSVNKDSKIYKQQPNSMIFFREDHHNALNDCRKQLHKLEDELERLRAGSTSVK